jgi:DNA-binding response OmpR family regulator
MYDRSVSAHQPLRVLIYSDDRDVRATVVAALGARPHPDLPTFEFVECATEPVVWQHLDATAPGERIDLAILDGEAVPAGGMGVARQMKDEIFQAPPALVITGRPQDAWLATWSRADAAVSHPIEPIRLAEVVIDLARGVLQSA